MPDARTVIAEASSQLPEVELPDPQAYLDDLGNVVGSSDSPELNTALTLLADWAIGAVLISVIGGLVVAFL